MNLTRRDLLRMAAVVPLAAAASAQTRITWPIESIAKSPARVVLADGTIADAALQVTRAWDRRICTSRIKNAGAQPVRIREIVLFEYDHGHSADTPLYGEGFQMLSQTGGTIGKPVDLGNYTDVKHYRLLEPDGSRAFYGVITTRPAAAANHVLAFTSCRRFVGKFRLQPSSIQVVLDAENLELAPGEEWELEEFSWDIGMPRGGMLQTVADRINSNHPRLKFAAPPSGWCSWYCFGPNVTAEQVLANLDVIARDVPGLKYIQIDDGYQPAMGDWLETGAAFGGNVQAVLKQIRAKGFEPAIWVAPFIAEANSRLFKEHPDWFVKDEAGAPLRADRVTFGGWRRGPWYALDGTHPNAQQHLTHVFRTMREEWGCTYFKLDANFWGAIHGGRFHDPKASRVEAYRRGMQAVLRGSEDAFILGCNHPLWPSLGLIHGSRSSHDIKRSWDRIRDIARQNLMRNWQNGVLWWNDSDAVVLTGDLPEEEFRFHATAVYASGGMILSGDDLTTISPARLAMLKKLQPPTGTAARFDDDSLQLGTMRTRDGATFVLLNWDEQPREMKVALDRPYEVRELWTDANLGKHDGVLTVTVPGHGGRVLIARQPFDLQAFERDRILRNANRYLNEAPVTVTASRSPRSTGGRHDYFSEGDYWWPDPQNPNGPYIQRDGESNPGNFLAHRAALMRLSVHVPALVAAWQVTKQSRYADHARRHLRAWFMDEATRMNPHLLYSQAIHGRFTGRGIGIIDTVHLVEVARAVTALEGAKLLPAEEEKAFRDWFGQYLTWMTTHKYGIDEREARNNHGTCWVMQVAEFAHYVGREDLMAFCRERYRTVLVPNQIAVDGSFPEEMRRTKPYGYHLFNLDAMAMVCEILTTPQDNLWAFTLPDGRGIRKSFEFMVPFIADKKKWPHKPDVMYFDDWPVRQPALWFGGRALNEPGYIEVWRKLNPDPAVEEVVRNYFIRQPVLWN